MDTGATHAAFPARPPGRTAALRRPRPLAWPVTLAFLLVFPGFFVYHALVASGHLAPYLAGYSHAITVLALPLVTMSYAHDLKLRRWQLPTLDMALFVLVGYFLVVELIGIAGGAPKAIAWPHVSIALQYAMLFMMFRLFDPSRAANRRLLWLAVAVMSGIVLANLDDGAFVIAILDLPFDDKVLSTYQGYAFVYLVTALVLISHTRSLSARLLLYVLGTVCLFFNGARSEFVSFVAICLLLEGSFTRRLTWLLAGLGLLLGTVILLWPWLAELLPDSRVLNLLEVSADDSVLERRQMLREAWRSVVAHPVFGDYASYAVGEYAHNLLSVWVDFGIVGLLAFGTLLLAPLLDLVVRARQHVGDPRFACAIAFVGTAALLYLTAKNHEYLMLAIALAAYGRFREPLARALRSRVERPEPA